MMCSSAATIRRSPATGAWEAWEVHQGVLSLLVRRFHESLKELERQTLGGLEMVIDQLDPALE